jgi:hypothetical protein
MSIEFLDPSHEAGAVGLTRADRLATLEGATIAVISNGKKNTKPFFDAMADELKQHFKVADVIRITKSNYSAPVEPERLIEAEKWQAIISGIGD